MNDQDNAPDNEPRQEDSAVDEPKPPADEPQADRGPDETTAADGEADPTTAIVEVIPGAVAIFGEVPEGARALDLSMLPASATESLAGVMARLGTAVTASSNLSLALSQNLYVLDPITEQLLSQGATLAGKDGGFLGAVFLDGSIVRQGRFHEVILTPAQLGAPLGPTLNMMAIQVQLERVTRLVETSIRVTTQALKRIQQEQWSELAGLVSAVKRTVGQAKAIGGVPESLWHNVAGIGSDLDKQLDLYRHNVQDHIKQIAKLTGRARRGYLESNAEAILFDANALLHSLSAQTGYQAIRFAWASAEGEEHGQEALLATVIAEDAQESFDASLRYAAELVDTLRRELRIIAELPGRATLPLTTKGRDNRAARMTGRQLLEALEPLADMLSPAAPVVDIPEFVLGPEGLELQPYLDLLRWHLESDEEVQALLFPYSPGRRNVFKAIPAVLGRAVDASWKSLESDPLGKALEKGVAPTLVAVTGRRILLADPKDLRQRGMVSAAHNLEDVSFVRMLGDDVREPRVSLDVFLGDEDLRWVFPSEVDDESGQEIEDLLRAGAAAAKEEAAARLIEA